MHFSGDTPTPTSVRELSGNPGSETEKLPSLFRVTLLHTGVADGRTLPSAQTAAQGYPRPTLQARLRIIRGLKGLLAPSRLHPAGLPALPRGERSAEELVGARRGWGGAGRVSVVTSGRKRTLRAAAWKPAVTGISVAPRTLVSLALGSGCVGRACSSLELWRPGLTRPRPLPPPPPRPPPRARGAPAPARRPRRRLRPEGS